MSETCSLTDTSCDECTDHDISERSRDEMQNESESKKEGNINTEKKGEKNGAAMGMRLSERLRDVENEKEDCEEEEKGLEKKEEESTDNSYTNNSGRSVVNWKSEVEIEYAERRVVMSGKKKKKKKYGVVIKSFVLHKKKDRTYRCGQAKCNEIFDSIQERSKHIRKKHGMKVRKCKHCGARCETKWGFKKHMALHDKVK